MDRKRKEPKRTQIKLPERVDTFNLETYLSEIASALKNSGAQLILNMHDTRFISLPFIKRLAQAAEEGRREGKSVVLLNASEKVKKQIGIYSDINFFQIQREPSARVSPEPGVSADF